MKTEQLIIQKIIAEDGYVFVSKDKVEEYGLLLPREVCGKEVYLGVQASADSFEEMLESELKELKQKYLQLKEEASKEEESDPVEEKEESDPMEEKEEKSTEPKEEVDDN